MKQTLQSAKLSDYLQESEVVDYNHPSIVKLSEQLFDKKQTDIEKAEAAFTFVRDEIAHSWDIQSTAVTRTASEVWKEKEGICYAKSNLLAALLRSEGIPTGFCYQRLMLFDKPEKGYCIHALNSVYLKTLERWIRVDARGNKPGVHALFSTTEEHLAFQTEEDKGEKDYPVIYTQPNEKTMQVLQTHTDALHMYLHHLPDDL
ncbi:UNVERIFIED_CONTAM: transglutaminase family protein [Halobacillus marinus]|uniref:transglutaminase-like domain-containing protein n=1 Tax=Bacillaceae TaxID=186817 RepID=UPI00047E5EFC|nr:MULTISPECIES: transglutaminase family protein [Bacillaceae]QHT47852.1 transglutaminase family protein [Bacillus sp. SB49]